MFASTARPTFPGISAAPTTAIDDGASSERNEASTEELRKAVVHYRALFDELLEIQAAEPVVAVPSLAVHT